MLPLRISASSGVPVYLQIEQQVRQSIASGLLQPGDALPSTRKLAAELRVNPNTVARAFGNLERDGVIRTVPGGGTYVATAPSVHAGLVKAEKLRRLRPIADQLAVEAAQLRVPAEDVQALLEAALKDLDVTSQTGSESAGGKT
jgi:GntR family transcriptional regulator